MLAPLLAQHLPNLLLPTIRAAPSARAPTLTKIGQRYLTLLRDVAFRTESLSGITGFLNLTFTTAELFVPTSRADGICALFPKLFFPAYASLLARIPRAIILPAAAADDST
ncbi:MAG: hypothetical protein Q9209_003276 [Squamulea sp. 1 TL-2023]